MGKVSRRSLDSGGVGPVKHLVDTLSDICSLVLTPLFARLAAAPGLLTCSDILAAAQPSVFSFQLSYTLLGIPISCVFYIL